MFSKFIKGIKNYEDFYAFKLYKEPINITDKNGQKHSNGIIVGIEGGWELEEGGKPFGLYVLHVKRYHNSQVYFIPAIKGDYKLGQRININQIKDERTGETLGINIETKQCCRWESVVNIELALDYCLQTNRKFNAVDFRDTLAAGVQCAKDMVTSSEEFNQEDLEDLENLYDDATDRENGRTVNLLKGNNQIDLDDDSIYLSASKIKNDSYKLLTEIIQKYNKDEFFITEGCSESFNLAHMGGNKSLVLDESGLLCSVKQCEKEYIGKGI